MSLVSNYIGAIPSNFGSKEAGKPEFDLSDSTFSDLLDKQMNIQNTEPQQIFQTDVAPVAAGESTNLVDLISSIKNTQPIPDDFEWKTDDLGTSEMVAFLTKPFDSRSSLQHNNTLMDFVKRQASDFYHKCASNVVTDLQEFVEDTLKLT